MTKTNYHKILFDRYDERLAYLDQDAESKIDWFTVYVQRAYLPFMPQTDISKLRILDIGCSKGYLLRALQKAGFTNLTGIDVSPVDIKDALRLHPDITFIHADGLDYLAEHPESYDVIFIKAVLEHVPKEQTIPLLQQIQQSLTDRGIALVDVPNMDWLFANHERYLDFTHEAGFTQESLRQIMSVVFSQVSLHPIDNFTTRGAGEEWRKRLARFLITRLLYWADPQGANNPLWARSLVGVGTK